ncbi:hypothetical protein PG988_010035 [Apiospora saccharicola]
MTVYFTSASRLFVPCSGRLWTHKSICQTSWSRTITKRHERHLSTHRNFPALFVRGGTSNGLVIKRDDLPPEDRWHEVLPLAMGSPDPYGRQLNGMGVKHGALDMAGNCGNLSSAVGPRAWDLGLVSDFSSKTTWPSRGRPYEEALVRIFNTNTSKIMHSRFRVAGNPSKYCPEGDYAIDGVPGAQSRITLGFLNPAGAKTGRALPTGNPIDLLSLRDGSQTEASLVDVSNPGVFIRASDLGTEDGKGVPPQTRLELIRQAGAEKMGLDSAVESVPKIVTLFPASDKEGIDIRCLALSMGQAHRAVPLTLALCLGAAANMPGTIPAQLARHHKNKSSTLRIGHPTGKVDIGTTFKGGHIVSAELHRTARYMMEGIVYY